MDDLKLIALDGEDLSVISAHLQDSVMRVGDFQFDAGAKRFAGVINRFDWLAAVRHRGVMKSFVRKRAGLRFERVNAVRAQKVDLSDRGQVLSLLALGFEKGELPGGRITMLFSGGAEIELDVECIEVELRDLGAAWGTRAKPIHRTRDTGRD